MCQQQTEEMELAGSASHSEVTGTLEFGGIVTTSQVQHAVQGSQRENAALGDDGSRESTAG